MERNTLQKKIVYDTLLTLGNHPTAEEIYSLVHKTHPSVSKATVYRNLSQMELAGKVKRIAVSDGADHFDHMTHEHLHFHCEHCGRISDISDSDNVSQSIRIPLESGKIIRGYEILFYGICEECSKNVSNE